MQIFYMNFIVIFISKGCVVNDEAEEYYWNS